MKEFNKVVFLIIILICVAQAIYAEEYDKSWLINKFNELDLAINNGEGYSTATNESGTLAWAQSYLLEAYLDMYKGTRDKRYIDKFLIQAKRVINSTDKARNITDYKGRSLYGWSSQRYSRPFGWKKGDKIDLGVENKPRVVLWVHTGMIVYPFEKFGLLVKSDQGLKKYKQDADTLVKFAKESVAVFKDRWRYDKKTKEGYFSVEEDEPVNWNYDECKGNCREAINGDLAIGRVFIGLCQLTANIEYCEKAKALAIKFKNNLIEDGERYIWHYRYKEDQRFNKRIEDISHGAIDVDFAVQAYMAGIVFTKEDLKKFAKTLIKVKKKDDKFFMFVDGTDDEKNKTDYSDVSGRWLELSMVDCGVYEVVYNYMKNRIKNSKKEHPQVLLGIAKLIKYYDGCYGK